MILAIVQVRMGSSRLSGKAFLEIEKKPMLWHVFERTASSALVEKTVIATADTHSSRPIAEFARENRIECFAGDENDLIDRLYKTAREFKGDIIVRITGDCPLIDPGVIDKVIRFYLDNADSCDYASNIIKPTYPDGLDVEVVPFRTLEKIWKEVKDTFSREWAFRCIVENPVIHRIKNVENTEDLSGLRWTVDYEEDLIFAREIFKRLYDGKKIFSMQDILAVLQSKPHLCKINAKYTRNSAYYKAKEEAKG